MFARLLDSAAKQTKPFLKVKYNPKNRTTEWIDEVYEASSLYYDTSSLYSFSAFEHEALLRSKAIKTSKMYAGMK